MCCSFFLCATCLALNVQVFLSFREGDASHLACFGHGPPVNRAYGSLSRHEPSFVTWRLVYFCVFALLVFCSLNFRSFLPCFFVCGCGNKWHSLFSQPFLSHPISFQNNPSCFYSLRLLAFHCCHLLLHYIYFIKNAQLCFVSHVTGPCHFSYNADDPSARWHPLN